MIEKLILASAAAHVILSIIFTLMILGLISTIAWHLFLYGWNVV